MPPRKTNYRKKRAPKRYAKKPTSNSAISLMTDNMAKLSSVQTPTSGQAIQSQTMYSGTFQLANSARATALAPNYSQYKIDYVEVRIKPLFDTFVNSITASYAPNLYFYINKSGQSGVTTLTNLKSMGLNPKPFSKDGFYTYRFKPSVIIDVVGGTTPFPQSGSAVMRKNSPWLNTNILPFGSTGFNLDTTLHWGYNLFIEVPGATATDVATIEVETHFCFRYPLSVSAPGDQLVLPRNLSC